MEYCGIDAFGLIQAIYGLHEGVIVCVTDTADRGCDPFEFEVFGEPDRCVLLGFNWSLQH